MSIEVITGPMFSGKSTELLRRLRRRTIANCKTLLVHHSVDKRYTEESRVATHDGISHAATISTTALDSVIPLFAEEEYDTVCIDEGQFFPDLVEFCEKCADSGRLVIVAGLDMTYEQMPFVQMAMLMAVADSVTKLNAVCTACGENAIYSKRLASSSEVVLVGSHDEYVPRCRLCYERDYFFHKH